MNLSDAVTRLRARRKELSDQLEALDTVLAALDEPRSVRAPDAEENPAAAAEEAPTEVVPTRLKPSRRLSDNHRHALREGRRNARHSKDVAAGRARELPDPRPSLSSAATADGRRPRLVKQGKR